MKETSYWGPNLWKAARLDEPSGARRAVGMSDVALDRAQPAVRWGFEASKNASSTCKNPRTEDFLPSENVEVSTIKH